MQGPSPSMEPTVSPGSRSSAGTRLHGRWLLFTRTLWVVVVTLSVGLFITASVQYAPQLSAPQNFFQASLLHPDPSLSGFFTFNSHTEALMFGSAAGLLSVFTSISSVIWIAVGLVLFWRKSDDWMTLLVAFGLITLGVAFSPQLSFLYPLADQHAPWRLLFPIVNLLGWGSVGLFFFLFPNGRFVPRWMAWVALCSLAFQVSQSLPSNSPFSLEQRPPVLLAFVVLVLLFSAMYSQLYRYRHRSSLVERQQAKWVVFGIVLSLLVFGVFLVPPRFFPPLAQPGLLQSFYGFISACVFLLVLNLIPLTIGVAVLRYRLWDIDVLINRTFVYSTLTVMLALIYFGLVIGLESLVRLFTGQVSQSPVIIVASTLAIAALFQPLRKRIQAIIDRRFYRRKYDTAKTLAAFSATLRNEVDLDDLSRQLVAVVQETMQPAHVSLWLRPPTSDNKYQATWISTPPAPEREKGR